MTKRIDLDLILTLAARIESIRNQMTVLNDELSEAKDKLSAVVNGDKPKPETVVVEASVTEVPPLSSNKRRAKMRNRIRRGSDPLVREYRYVGGVYARAARNLNIGSNGHSKQVVWVTDEEADKCLLWVYRLRAERGGPDAKKYWSRLKRLERLNNA
jgi:hypothetical protein